MQDNPGPARPEVAVTGATTGFRVGRIFCVGRNYADHAREMGSDPSREPPCFFTKPADAVSADGVAVSYPPHTQDLHHEVELVVALGEGGRDIRAEEARQAVFGYAVGNDLTRRDLQAAAKDRGQPWDLAKGFDQAAPIGAIRPAADCGHPRAGHIWLSVNGQTRQTGDLARMIWGVDEVIALLSGYLTLKPGDLIFTGTPAGVGPLVPGDRVEACIDGLARLSHAVAPAEGKRLS